jgi:hypothetical protein
MADVDEKGERRLGQVQNRALDSQPDAQSARNAGASDVKAVQALNRNAHSGSAGGDQDESLEIVMPKRGGGYDVLASRQKAEIKPELMAGEVKTAPIKQAVEPLTVDFLRDKAKGGNVWARSFIPEIEAAERLPTGATRDFLLERVLEKAEVIFRPEDRRKAQPGAVIEDQSQTSTGTIIARQAEKNPVLEPVKAHYNWAADKLEGAERDKHLKLAKEQLLAIEPQAKGALDALDQKRQLMAQLEDCGVHEVLKRTETPLQGQIQYPEKEIEGVRRLTPQDLQKLAKAFEAAGPAAEESIKQTAQEILVRTGESSRDTVLAGINLVVGLLKYDRDLLVNPAKAREEAGQAGEALGLLMLAGVKVSFSAAGTVGEAKESGDYSLPLRRVGAALNSWYEKQSPADQMAIMSEMCAGFGMGAFAGEANKLRKPGAFAEFLKEGLETLPRNPEAERKALETLARVLKGGEPLREAPVIGAVEKTGEVVKEVQEQGLADHIMEMTSYIEHGNKTTTAAGEVAAKLGVSKKELNRMTEEELAKHGVERIEKRYDRLFFSHYPHLKDTGLEVHHALPQKLLDKRTGFAGLFKAKEVNAIEYLRGIPVTAMKDGERVHDLITARWERFLPVGKKVTRQDVLNELKAIDKEFGRYFVPPH